MGADDSPPRVTTFSNRTQCHPQLDLRPAFVVFARHFVRKKFVESTRMVSIGPSTLFANLQYFIIETVLGPILIDTFFLYVYAYMYFLIHHYI